MATIPGYLGCGIRRLRITGRTSKQHSFGDSRNRESKDVIYVGRISFDAFKVDVTKIVDRHIISEMNAGIKALQSVVDEFMSTGQIQEVGWNRMRSLEFQEILRSRITLAEKLAHNVCLSCPDFQDHVWPRLLLLVCDL